MPDSLLIDPCDSVEAGETVGTLAKAYITNTVCIKEYKLLLEKQRRYKHEVEVLTNGRR